MNLASKTFVLSSFVWVSTVTIETLPAFGTDARGRCYVGLALE